MTPKHRMPKVLCGEGRSPLPRLALGEEGRAAVVPEDAPSIPEERPRARVVLHVRRWLTGVAGVSSEQLRLADAALSQDREAVAGLIRAQGTQGAEVASGALLALATLSVDTADCFFKMATVAGQGPSPQALELEEIRAQAAHLLTEADLDTLEAHQHQLFDGGQTELASLLSHALSVVTSLLRVEAPLEASLPPKQPPAPPEGGVAAIDPNQGGPR